jgi:SAM-dependent methyltransferase
VNVPDPTELVRDGYDSVSYRYRGDHDNPAGYAPWLTNLQRRLPTNASVLDLGCGCGIPVAKALTDNGHHVTGVDLSEVQINRANSFPKPRSCTTTPPGSRSPTARSMPSSASTHSSTCRSTHSHT